MLAGGKRLTAASAPRRFNAILMALAMVGAIGAGCAGRPPRESAHELCPGIEIRGDGIRPGLSDAERALVCGDEQGMEGWKKIPANQAWFHLKAFLQDRGRYRATWRAEGGGDGQPERAIVELGALTYVTSLEATGAPPELRLERKRRVKGELLTPKLLGSVEGWTTLQLQAEGYPCPVVRSEGDPESGRLRLLVEPGPRQALVSVVDTGIPGVGYGIPRRYDAFALGDRYDGEALALTENRMTQLGVVQSTHFVPSCGPGGAQARQEFVAGPPRLLSFGIGTNTESLLVFKASWRNSRLGLMASWLDVTGLASFKEQRIETTFNWYHLPFGSRRSIRPSALVRHQNEDAFEDLTERGKLQYATTWDGSVVGLEARLGPGVEQIRTLRGTGPINSRFVPLDGDFIMQSHGFEYHAGDPRSGFKTELSTSLASDALLSSASAQRLNWSGQGLWNLRDYDPPFFVVGLRGGFLATLSDENPGPASKLPPRFYNYLGGSGDLRGFGRKELPDDEGAKTVAYANLELRLADVLPFGFQPVAFYDVGATGKGALGLGSTIYTSPGLGFRLASPIGVFRTTLARGYAAGVARHYQFYLSFGEEF